MTTLQQAETRGRDDERERWERLRYRLLEHLYALTARSTGTPVRDPQLEGDLGLSLDGVALLTRDLERLGYLTMCPAGSWICVTQRGIEYLEAEAWRRRSVRT